MRELIAEIAAPIVFGRQVTASIDTWDDDGRREVYLSVAGLSIEFRDEAIDMATGSTASSPS